MSYFKKIFYTSALLIVAGALPSVASAATSNVASLKITPTKVDSLYNKPPLTFTVSAFNASGQPETVNTEADVTLLASPTQGSFNKTPFTNLSTFTFQYNLPTSGADGLAITITVTVNTKSISATVLMLQGFPAGHTCNPSAVPSECFTGTTCDASVNLCIPNVENRKIGTFCTTVEHCKTSTQTLELTCSDDINNPNTCVGATQNVQCSDSAINPDSHYGKTASDLDSTERCATFLLCSVDGKCVNDIGQGAIPSGSIGETATDIRDQIRNLINIALGFLGVAGVIVTLYGGFTWMTAFGDDEKVGKAKKTIVAGIIGIIIIGVAWTIVSYVLNVTSTIS